MKLRRSIGIDVGTGSARACIIDGKGDIVGMASENIGLWQPEQGYYVSTLLRKPLCVRRPQTNLDLSRNNLQMIFGDASATPCSGS